ncbi:unnamed protein product [Spirodela intermedia]|uniref:FHA domain-containing protein n=1 Tax=Spirodela intermedia TaxID=51605 RepID=A0A7I8JQM2_SPIIN|nr:unnamed protein product [Spirodela intermedia]CAA6672469.1 unnamed protein product [Spirodela intermedia]
MKVPMGPPPPRKQNPHPGSSSNGNGEPAAARESSSDEAYAGSRQQKEVEQAGAPLEGVKFPMGPTPPRSLIPPLVSSAKADGDQPEEPQFGDGGIAEPKQPGVPQDGIKVPMGPPPPRIPNPPPNLSSNLNGVPAAAGVISPEEAQVSGWQQEESEQACAPAAEVSEGKEVLEKPTTSKNSARSAPPNQLTVPYVIPPWSEPPGNPFHFEILKDGSIIGQLDVSEKGAYMFGRVDLCDFVLEHPTISRFHAVLQFRKDSEAFIYDLGSTHGTFVNKNQIRKKSFTEVHVGDIIRFGQSSRLYIFQGPSELMPLEGDLKKLRNAKLLEEMHDREASLSRARVEASMKDGISWGMAEDAIEDISENDAEEVTWQTYRGQLTERQEKTRSKIIKRMEKVANMRKEIDSIRAKDISQGGLTQGQQTQIARNEQRMAQIMEELDSLEETLNESIQESIGARVKTYGKKKGTTQDEDEDVILSDDDEFYDRTKKPQLKKSGEQQIVETAETLLDKKEILVKQMEEKTNLLQEENSKMVSATQGLEEGDELDAYMTGLSSQLVLDKTTRIQGELSALKSELDRILYLLKIADPSGEAAKKRESKKLEPRPTHKTTSESKKISVVEKPSTGPSPPGPLQAEEPPAGDKAESHGQIEGETPVYSVSKPQWLGAVKEGESAEGQKEGVLEADETTDEFVDYKDRKILVDGEGIEDAAPGLIIRKRKQAENPKLPEGEASMASTSTSVEAETAVADAVALLLKHKRGTLEEEEEEETKRVLGPERPSFLERSPDYEEWVPPEGQSGDGRTSLNDRLGY